MKNLLLTFDLEEFDLPLEYGIKLSEKEQLRISYLGLLNILKILEVNNVRATFFVTYNFASHFPNALKNIAKKHEIALHGFSHSDDYNLMSDKDFLNLIGLCLVRLVLFMIVLLIQYSFLVGIIIFLLIEKFIL